ncbi:MAG: hypothetical protein JW927_06250 [Deltaproteobacteria bacterium]|nr:hypothetical protein [Deltaproteobacteria bacterium]
MSNDRYLCIVASRPNPGKEEDYNKWYDRHVTTFFGFPGLKKVVRNKFYQGMQNPESCPQYLVTYEFDTKADLDAFLTSDAAKEAIREYEEEWSGKGEFLWSGFYEPVKKLER